MAVNKEIETFKKPLSLGAGIFLQNSKGEVLLGKRTSESGLGLWCLPGGLGDKIDQNIYDTVIRELEEESGINRVGIIGLISIDDSEVYTKKCLNFGVWGATDQEPQVVDLNEISEWRWFLLDELPADREIFVPSLTTIKSFLQYKIQTNFMPKGSSDTIQLGSRGSAG